jgi:hypothetical protein
MYKMYRISLDPVLIGQADLVVLSSTSPVLIKQPNRSVDKFFNIFVRLMSVFFSVALGILLEKEQMEMILKKPVAPVCGFLVQYICMPLVRFNPQNRLEVRTGINKALSFLVGLWVCQAFSVRPS